MAKYFISCNNPVTIKTSKGNTLVGCGKCVQCRQAKADNVTLLLDLESKYNKYVEMITLTYSDEFCPYLDFSSLNQGTVGNFCLNNLTYASVLNVVPFSFGGNNYKSYRQVFPSVPVVLGDRKKRQYNPKTKTYQYVTDKSALNNFAPLGCGFNPEVVEEYNERVDNYYRKRSFVNARGECSQHNHVRILWYSDVLKYHDRLRQFIRKNYETEIRYYTVGEYGSASLRPHWHILLFHNSDKLHRDFTEVDTLTGSTSAKPRQVCHKLNMAQIWLYGDTVTTTTDKHISSYLSGYLTQHSRLPRVLDKFPQRSFHSAFLGVGKDKQQVASLLKDERFEELCSDYVVNRQGVSRDVSVPDSCYRQFAVRFTSSTFRSVEENYALLAAANKVLEVAEVDIYNESELYSLYDYMLSFHFLGDDYTARSFRMVQEFIISVCMPIYQEKRTLNPLFSFFYASKRLYKIADYLGLYPLVYLRKVDKLLSWLNYQRLIRQFHLMEIDYNYAYQYYSTFDGVDVCQNFHLIERTSLFRKQQAEANISFTSNVKHREVVNYYNGL